MMELLDIDLDAAVRNTAGSLPRGVQSVCEATLDAVRQILGRTKEPVWFMDEHLWAIQVWQQFGVRGARVWHIDAHHDAYGSTDATIWSSSCGSSAPLSRAATSATYLLAAWRAGLISEVVWLVPEWLGVDSAAKDIEREMGGRPTFISIDLVSNLPRLVQFDLTTVAWSRRWIDTALHNELVRNLPTAALAQVISGTPLVSVTLAPSNWVPRGG
jgi:hypothetical protein